MKPFYIIILVFLGALLVGCQSATDPVIKQITTEELATLLQEKDDNMVFIDVREPYEYNEGHIAGMINMPLSTLDQTYEELSKKKEIIIICRSGNRSMKAANKLKDYGYTKLVNVQGGVSSWKGELVK
jgi:rhodanese-related sulfurtransferase